MPTYEYVCESCGYTFDAFQNMSDEPIKQCPRCGQEVRRLIGTGVGVIFKGKRNHIPERRSDDPPGRTCCGRTQRCETPPCSDTGTCIR